MTLTLPLLSKYPVIALFLLQNSFSLSNIPIHFKQFPLVLMKDIVVVVVSTIFLSESLAS